MPVIFGTAAAVVIGNARFDVPLFLLSLLAMMTLHSAANMLNDVHDFRKGLDKEPTPVSGAIVRGLLTTEQVMKGAVVLLVVGSLIGLVIVWRVGLPVLYIGIAGLIIGVCYTGTAVRVEISRARRPRRFPRFRHPRRARRVDRSDRIAVMAARHLGRADVHARRRHPAREQLARHRGRHRQERDNHGVPARRPRLVDLLRDSDFWTVRPGRGPDVDRPHAPGVRDHRGSPCRWPSRAGARR